MPTGLRASDAPTLQRLCGSDQRLFLRIGQLLQAKLAFTEPALGEIVGNEALKKVALDKRMREVDATTFAALLAEHGGDGDLVLVDGEGEAGWRVIAVVDELGNPLLAPAPAEVGGAAILATLSPALRAPVEGLLHAGGDEQRAAALEQLRYAAPPLSVVSELMPMLLADGAELVRERAINLLVAAGAQIAVIDLVRALQRGDLAQLGRIADAVSNLAPLQRDVACAALIAMVGRGLATQPVVDGCARLAGHLAVHPGLDRLMELLLPTRLNMVDLVRALQACDAQRVDTILARSLGLGPESDAQAIVLLAGPGRAGEDRLLDRGLDILLATDEAAIERMALAMALRRLDRDNTLPARIAARGMAISGARDTTVYWMLAEIFRERGAPPAVGDQFADTLRKLLREAPGPHLVAILEHQLPALVPAGDAARAALVEPLGESVARFRDERSRDLVTTTILTIGAPAITPLWSLLEEHPHPSVRGVAAQVLPELLIARAIDEIRAAVGRLLALATEPARERAPLLTAAARLASAPALAGDVAPTSAVLAATAQAGDQAIDALGWLAAGPHIDPGTRAKVLEDMLGAVTAELPDTPMESKTDPSTLDVTYVIDQVLGVHTEIVPRVLMALARMGVSPHLPPQLLRRLVDRLCHQWQLVSSWKVVWGPGNIQELGKTLGHLASQPAFPGPLRLRVAEALLPRIAQLTVARALARVLAAAEGAFLSGLAGKAALTLVTLAAKQQFADDEQEELADTLVDFLAIPHLGSEGDAIRRRLVGLLTANRTRLTGRGRQRLRGLLPGLDESVRTRLEWAG